MMWVAECTSPHCILKMCVLFGMCIILSMLSPALCSLLIICDLMVSGDWEVKAGSA